jgi:prolyl-tRNA editing enzyme YbaK/EbsC (Cys-tRNA(Pro) deacylase)
MDLVVRPVMMRDSFGSLLNSGVPPFGHSRQLRVFIDPDLLQWPEVWAAAGTWNDVFGIEPHKLVEASGGVVTDLKRG